VCGEDAITTVVKPGVWAHEPIITLVKEGKLTVPTGDVTKYRLDVTKYADR